MFKTLTTFAVAGIVLTSLPAMAASANRTVSFQTLEGNHPKSHQQVLVVPKDSEGDVYACFGYAHDGKKKGDVGFHTGKVTITRTNPDTDEETVEVLNKRGTLAKNKWLRCVHTGPVVAGDMFVFDYGFSGHPKPRGNTIHIKSSVGMDRMLIGELRGPEAAGDPGDPTQLHQRETTVVAENGKHPKAWQQAIVVQNDSLDKVQLCFGYGNTLKKGDVGKATFKAEIPRTDADTGEPTVEKITKKKNLKDNRINQCVEIDAVLSGDVIVVNSTLEGFPKLRGNEEVAGEVGDAFQIITGIGPTAMLDVEVLGPKGSGGGGGAGPGGGGGGEPPTAGALSAADQSAVRRLFGPNFSSAQLWRPKGNLLGKWTTIDNRTKINPAFPLNVNPTTVGQGATIAESVADLEKKNGKHPAVSGGLSAAEQECIAWMGTIKTSQGSTSIRFGPNGSGWHGELYRPSLGAIASRSKSMLAACQWIRATLGAAGL